MWEIQEFVRVSTYSCSSQGILDNFQVVKVTIILRLIGDVSVHKVHPVVPLTGSPGRGGPKGEVDEHDRTSDKQILTCGKQIS